MKVTIDTKEDSHEDILKVVRVLQHMLQQQPEVSQEPVDTTSMMGMFSNPEQEKPTEDSAPDFSSFLNLANKEHKPDDEPKVEFF